MSAEEVLASRSRWEIIGGDCRELMAAMPEASVDAVVCDPPYLLNFMGKEFDSQDGAHSDPARMGEFHLSWAREAFRGLKPGGHLLAFGGTRTYHRLASAVEDAGFEIRDMINWVYGSGFPKSMDVTVGIDRAVGTDGDREVVGPNPANRPGNMGTGVRGSTSETVTGWVTPVRPDKTAPASKEARAWSGWGTALKPGHEPILVARKPLVGTVAENLLRHGVGAINVGATRVGFSGPADRDEATTKNAHADFGSGARENRVYGEDLAPRGKLGNWAPPGRWPPNLVLTHSPACVRVGTRVVEAHAHYPQGSLTGYGANLGADTGGKKYRYDAEGPRPDSETVEAWECVEGCPVAALDRQSGVTEDGIAVRRNVGGSERGMFNFGQSNLTEDHPGFGGSGGASRFFPAFGWDVEEASFLYEPKAARAEREAGLRPGADHTTGPMAGRGDGIEPVALRCRRCGRWKVSGAPCVCPEPDFERVPFDRPAVANTHPTVKPIALMRWLVRLPTPPGGIVLDPFAGSGSTGCAAVAEGFRFIGIDSDPAYCELARKRIAHWATVPRSRLPSNPLVAGPARGQRRLDEVVEP